ncbi:PIN domain nuclease [Candidatus Poribacteria bacterium]|nr:PIN domain nuclease [Candidatus Poribacteria bacterium]
MTSKPGGKRIESVVADANVILSAIIGKASLKVFTRSAVHVVSAAVTLEEVWEYLPTMSAAYGIAREVLEAQFRLLAIAEYKLSQYRRFIPTASRLIGKRDPDDVELPALALYLGIPLWTNDKDFDGAGVECYSTARLLKTLGL